MEHKRYQKTNKEGKTLRTVSITEEQAKRFNKHPENEGETYRLEAAKESSLETKVISIDDKDYLLKTAIKAFNDLEAVNKKLPANTGVKKTVAAISEIDEECKIELLEVLNK